MALAEVCVCLSVSRVTPKVMNGFCMKFSGKIEDGTNNKPLNFGSGPWPVCLSLNILLENL